MTAFSLPRVLVTYSVEKRGSVYRVLAHRGEVQAVAATFMNRQSAEEAAQRFAARAKLLNTAPTGPGAA